jgi:hydrogenase maturation protease
MRGFIRPERLLEARPGARALGKQSGEVAGGGDGRGAERRNQWEVELTDLLEDAGTPLHLVGVGNPLRRDDSVGLHIVSRLVTKLGRRPRRNLFVHPPASTPERLLSRVDCAKGRVLIFDAVASGGQPGRVILASLDDSKFGYFATHNVPIRVLPGVAANPSNVYVAGIEPESLDVGEELSEAVLASANSISAVVESALGGGSDGPS